MVFHADPGGEDTGNPNDIWSHKSTIYYTTDDDCENGGKIHISDYAIQPEEKPDESIITISVICHEFGHVMGLPDLYDYSRWTLGVGIWGLMGYGAWGGDGLDGRYPSHLCAWSKDLLDWVNPTVITGNEDDLLLRPVEQYPDVYKIWRNGSPGQEYFLIANRQNVGFDLKLKGTGILVWHIDNTIYEAHNKVDLEEADGLDDLENGDGERPDPLTDNIGDDGDPYPGSSYAVEFSPTSYPNSDDNDGSPTDITINDFQTNGLNLTCDVILNTSGEEEDEGTVPAIFALYPAYPNPSSGIATIPFALPETAEVDLSVYDIKGRKIAVVIDGTLAAGEYDADISGLSSGVYIYSLKAGDYAAAEKMVVK
jgi:immune inhibitor A